MAVRAHFPRLRRALGATALLLLCALLGAAWLAGSETALRWVAAQAVQASGGQLALEDVQGSLYGRVHVGSFAFDDGARRIEGRRVEFDWSPRELLLRRTVLVRSLALHSLSVRTLKPSAAPAQLPATLRLPLRLEIRSATIDTLTLAGAGASQTLRALALQLQNPPGQYRALASAQTPWGKGESELTLADSAPFALSGSAKLSRSNGPHAYALRATLTGTLADLALSASGNSRGAEAELRAAFAPFAHLPLRQATLHLSGFDARRFAEGLPRTDIGGELRLRAEDNDAFAGELALSNGRAGSAEAALVPLRAARFAFAGVADALELTDLRLDLGDAGVLEGTGALRDGRLNLALGTAALDLRGVYAKLATTKLAGTLKLDVQASTQEVQADLREGEYRVRIDVSHQGDMVRVRSAQVSVAGGVLDLNGELSLAGSRAFRAEGKLARFDPSRLGEYPEAQINGSVSASGRLSPRAEAQVQFTTSNSRFRGQRLHGSGAARVSAQRVWDSNVALQLGANRLSARGAFGAAGDSLDWRLEGKDLAAFAAQLRGELQASGRLEGTLDEPSGTVLARGRNLAWAGEHRLSDISIEGSLSKGIDGPLALTANMRDYRGAALRIGAASITAAGRRGDHQLKLAARNDAIDAHAALAGGWNAATGWSGRILSFDNGGRYAVALQAPASLTLKDADFSLADATLGFARGTVRIDQFARRAGAISSSGMLSGIDTGYLIGLADRPLGVSSTLTLGGKWRFALAQKINGEFELRREHGDLSVLTEPATALGMNRLALTAAVADDGLTVQLDAAATAVGAASGSVRTTLARDGASLGLPASAALAFDAELSVPTLAWLTPLLGGRMALDGSLKGHLGAQGTVAEPHFSGSIAADGLKFEIPEQGVYLKDGKLRARLQENALVLEQLVLRGGEGKVEGSGSIAWDSGKASARVAIKADKLEVLKRLDRHLILSGNAEAAFADKRVHATAKLKADKGEITLPSADAPTLSADVVVLGRDSETATRSAAFASDIELDLDLGDQFHLTGRGIDARLAGVVRVRAASDAQATASGSIRVAQGSYSAYGQRLAIERGVLNFIGPLDNPGLDIVALRKQQAVEAGVAIRGTALAPRVSLVSNPNVPDSEKLSWLVLGRGMEGANRTDLALLQTAASVVLARGESISLQSRIAHAAGLDEFSLSGTGGLESTALTLGKRLSSRAYLTFEQGLASATNLVKINYTLTPRLSLRAQTGTESALDAFYTFSFK